MNGPGEGVGVDVGVWTGVDDDDIVLTDVERLDRGVGRPHHVDVVPASVCGTFQRTALGVGAREQQQHLPQTPSSTRNTSSRNDMQTHAHNHNAKGSFTPEAVRRGAVRYCAVPRRAGSGVKEP